MVLENTKKGKIGLKKEGYAETTITTRVKLLKILAKRGADLRLPESVKETISH